MPITEGGQRGVKEESIVLVIEGHIVVMLVRAGELRDKKQMKRDMVRDSLLRYGPNFSEFNTHSNHGDPTPETRGLPGE